MKPKKGAKKAHPKKVFDVMRPGKTAAGATSRPVIVGHKPQIKDPMMSEHDEARPLLDSKQKVAVAPTTTPATTEAASPPVSSIVENTPDPATPQSAETFAAVALADTVEVLAPESDSPPKPAQTPVEASRAPAPIAAQQMPAAQDPAESVPKTPAGMPETKSTGIIFEDIPTNDTPPVSSGESSDGPAEPVEPLPVLPPEEMPKAQVFVAHHSSAGGLKVFLILLAVVVLAIVAFDIMLDAGFVTLNGIPHTDFL